MNNKNNKNEEKIIIAKLIWRRNKYRKNYNSGDPHYRRENNEDSNIDWMSIIKTTKIIQFRTYEKLKMYNKQNN